MKRSGSLQWEGYGGVPSWLGSVPDRDFPEGINVGPILSSTSVVIASRRYLKISRGGMIPRLPHLRDLRRES